MKEAAKRALEDAKEAAKKEALMVAERAVDALQQEAKTLRELELLRVMSIYGMASAGGVSPSASQRAGKGLGMLWRGGRQGCNRCRDADRDTPAALS